MKHISKFRFCNILFLLFTPAALAVSACAEPKQVSPVAELIEPAGVTYDMAVAVSDDLTVSTVYGAYVVCYNEGLYFTHSDMPVKEILAVEGDYVKKGDVLLKLDTETVDIQISEQEDHIADIKARNDYANKLKEYDIRLAELSLAQQRQNGADATRVAQLEYALDKLTLEYRHQMETQELELDRQNILLDRLKQKLSETALAADFDGRIIHIADILPGEYAAAYKPIIFIADESRPYVKYSGRDYLRVGSTDQVYGRILDFGFELDYIPLPMDEFMKYVLDGKTPPTNFEIPNIDGRIKPGQYVSISLITKKAEDCIIIPVNAIYSGEAEEGTYVYVMEGGQKTLRKVTVGIRNESYVEIKEGLDEGDEVFVKQ